MVYFFSGIAGAITSFLDKLTFNKNARFKPHGEAGMIDQLYKKIDIIEVLDVLNLDYCGNLHEDLNLCKDKEKIIEYLKNTEEYRKFKSCSL